RMPAHGAPRGEGAPLVSGTGPSRDDGCRAVGQEDEDVGGGQQHRAGDTETGQRGGPEVADDGAVRQQEEGLGDERQEGRDGKSQDLPAVVGRHPESLGLERANYLCSTPGGRQTRRSYAVWCSSGKPVHRPVHSLWAWLTGLFTSCQQARLQGRLGGQSVGRTVVAGTDRDVPPPCLRTTVRARWLSGAGDAGVTRSERGAHVAQ